MFLYWLAAELDDYWVKGPKGIAQDLHAPVREVRAILKDLVRAGRARYTYAGHEDNDRLAGSGYVRT